MPWLDSEVTIPPINKEIIVLEDGKPVRRVLRDVEVFDGRGGISKKIPKYWQQCNGDVDAAVPSRDREGI